MKHAASSARVSGSRQRGFSVIELMVAMVISLLLLGGVVTIFISSKGTYERVERLSRTQEAGRFALDAIVRDIRSAGYIGCSRPSTWANTLNSSATLAWNFAESIVGYEFSSGTTWLPAGVPADMTNIATGADGSDALVLRVPTPAASSATLRLTDKMTSQTSTMKIAAVPSGATAPLHDKDDVVMVADCHARAVFQVTNYDPATGVIEHVAPGSGTPGNSTDDVGHAFEANSQIVPVRTVAYYIGKPAGGQPGLWRVAGGAAAEELVEGVERMELRFGRDTNSDRIADEYVTASSIVGADWGNVISVSVALLVRSPDQYGTERNSNTYTLLDKTFTAPADRYVRQVFVSTATLRNRAL